MFVTGEQPEKKYPEAKKWLKENGLQSTSRIFSSCIRIGIRTGLFPHTNAGNLNYQEMKELKKTNVSMGIMLENVSERLSEKGMPHYLAASKRPKTRLANIRKFREIRNTNDNRNFSGNRRNN